MSRKGKTRKNVRRITDEEIRSHVESSKRTIAILCDTFDSGHPYIAFTIASEVHRLINVGGVAIEARGRMRFPTSNRELSRTNLLPENKLIFAQTSSHPPQLTFLPAFRGDPFGTKGISFKDWWHRDPIYRAGAAFKGSDPTMIPLLAEKQTPFPEREILYRQSFVELMRNTLGAHLDLDQVDTLDALQRAGSWGGHFVVQTGSEVLSSESGTLPVSVGPAAAMMRQIAFEVLTAYSS